MELVLHRAIKMAYFIKFLLSEASTKPEASSKMRAFAGHSLFWYLSLFVMCKALYQYNERSQALTLLNSALSSTSNFCD